MNQGKPYTFFDELVIGIYAATNKILVFVCSCMTLVLLLSSEATAVKILQALVAGGLAGVGAGLGLVIIIGYLYWLAKPRYETDIYGTLTAEENRKAIKLLILVVIGVLAISAIGLLLQNTMGIWASVILLVGQLFGAACYVWEILQISPEM